MKMEVEKSTFVEKNLVVFRGQQVLFDMDVAAVYGVTTRQVNEAIKNNEVKFPEEKGYIIRLTEREFADFRSKFSTAKWSKRRFTVVENFVSSPWPSSAFRHFNFAQ